MCSGIEFAGRRVRWKDPDRQLPVLRRDGSIDWVRWGEDYGIESPFTNGACARHESVLAGKWRRFSPIPVKIPAASFMERDKRREEIWIDVPAGSFIQGLIARWQDQARVYVVTVPATPEQAVIHDRWPRIVTA